MDLTQQSVDRVGMRLAIRALPYDDLRKVSALAIPWSNDTFGLVFNHGVLHHIPDIRSGEAEIHRVLKPGGTLVTMLYARSSLNYQLSIKVVCRAARATAYPVPRFKLLDRWSMLWHHLDNAKIAGLRSYLVIDTFTHRKTDGPLNSYARVYSAKGLSETPATSSSWNPTHATCMHLCFQHAGCRQSAGSDGICGCTCGRGRHRLSTCIPPAYAGGEGSP